MALSANTHDSTKVYNASVNATAAEVTNNPNVLIYGIALFNTTGAAAYLQIFDADADDVTVGTTVPTASIGNAIGAAFSVEFSKPIRFTTGLTIASTTTRSGATNAAQEVTITYMDEA